MTSQLAEDLLKSRTIQELKHVVHELAKDGDLKKTELQGMVGSQYQEFIQSADKIIEMKKQASIVSSELFNFWSSSEKMLKSIESVLSIQNMNHARYENNFRELIADLNPHLIWKDLSENNVFDATIKILLVSFLLQIREGHLKTDEGHVFDNLKACHDQFFKSVCYTSSDLSRMRSSFFLYPVLIEDCGAYCFVDQDQRFSLLSKAKMFASLHCLKLISSNNSDWSFTSLLQIYFDCEDTKLNQIISSKLNSNNLGSDQDLEGSMVELVKLLQRVILDLYYLFVKKIKINDKEEVAGLVPFFCSKLLSTLHEKLCFVSGSSSTKPGFQSGLNFKGKDVLQSIKMWLHQKLTFVTEKCSNLLSSLSSAVQVAQMQQSVFSNCVRCILKPAYFQEAVKLFSVLSNHAAGDNKKSFSSTIWMESCYELLSRSSARKHQKTKSVENERPTTLLWVTVFRVSFLRQVERLLLEACEAIFRKTRSQILSALKMLGIEILFDREVKVLNKATTFQSSTIFCLAENIRRSIDEDLSCLLEDVISPVQTSESFENDCNDQTHIPLMSGNEVMGALRTNCSMLLGQLSSLLRRLSLLLNKTLVSSGKLPSVLSVTQNYTVIEQCIPDLLRRDFAKIVAETNFRPAAAEDNQVLLSLSLLFLGRFSWLLKCKCESIKAVLLEDTSSSSTIARSASNDVESLLSESSLLAISEDQLKSAFEIADSDGDGVIDAAETQEALLALSLDKINSNHRIDSIFADITNITYDEFVLLYGASALHSTAFLPFFRFRRCLDYLILNAHVIWSLTVVVNNFSYFQSQIFLDFGLDSVEFSQNRSFAAFWSTSNKGNLQEFEENEPILLPGSCSPSLQQFLYRISLQVSNELISMDTFQECYESPFPVVLDDSAFSSNDLFSVTGSILRFLLPFIRMLVHKLSYLTYEQVFMKSQQIPTENLSDYSSSLSYGDEISVQCILDLYCLKQFSVKDFDLDLLEKYRSRLDPVISELISDDLRFNAGVAVEKIRNLFYFDSGLESEVQKLTLNNNEQSLIDAKVVEHTIGELLSGQISDSRDALISARFGQLPLAMVAVTSTMDSSKSALFPKKGQNTDSTQRSVKEEKLSQISAVNDSSNNNGATKSIIKWW